jgi:hypothetical protein
MLRSFLRTDLINDYEQLMEKICVHFRVVTTKQVVRSGKIWKKNERIKLMFMRYNIIYIFKLYIEKFLCLKYLE